MRRADRSAQVSETRREVVARLSTAQKSNRGAAGYSRWVNRPLGRQFAALAYMNGFSPNQVSIVSACFTYAAILAIFVFAPSWQLGIAVTAALLLGYALDSADGQVARLSGLGSTAGEWLDHVLDAGKIATFHVAIAVMWFRSFHLGHPSLLLIPLGFGAISTTFFFAMTLSDMLRRVARVRAGGTSVTTASVNPNEPAPVIRSLIVLPNDYGVLCLAMLLIAARGWFFAIYTALFVANALFLLVGCARWFREMREF